MNSICLTNEEREFINHFNNIRFSAEQRAEIRNAVDVGIPLREILHLFTFNLTPQQMSETTKLIQAVARSGEDSINYPVSLPDSMKADRFNSGSERYTFGAAAASFSENLIDRKAIAFPVFIFCGTLNMRRMQLYSSSA